MEGLEIAAEGRPVASEGTPCTNAGLTAPAVELRGVTKVFRLESGAEIVAVNDVSLQIAAGEIVCVLGPSGQGKSTIVNLVAGFVKPTRGEILASGRPVTGPGADRGVVFQRDTLFAWRRVDANIAFGLEARGVPRDERDRIVARYLKVIDLEKFARAWPKQLSGGMRRRVAIAAVFANQPDVLLMDEPFVGLDYVRRASLHKVMLDLWRDLQSTILFVTHDIDEALALADRILVVANGRIVFESRVGIARPRSAESIVGSEGSRLRLEIMKHIGTLVAD